MRLRSLLAGPLALLVVRPATSQQIYDIVSGLLWLTFRWDSHTTAAVANHVGSIFFADVYKSEDPDQLRDAERYRTSGYCDRR